MTLSFLTHRLHYCLVEWDGNELKTYFTLEWKEGVVLIFSSVCGSTLFSSSLLRDCSCSTLTILTSSPSSAPICMGFFRMPLVSCTSSNIQTQNLIPCKIIKGNEDCCTIQVSTQNQLTLSHLSIRDSVDTKQSLKPASV